MINLKLTSLEHVSILASQVAHETQTDQAIYKTKLQGYDIFQFIPESQYKATPVRVIRFTRENISQDLLQDNGNERPSVISGQSKSAKRIRRRIAESGMDGLA